MYVCLENELFYLIERDLDKSLAGFNPLTEISGKNLVHHLVGQLIGPVKRETTYLVTSHFW